MTTITKSRNAREGRYAGWRATGAHFSLNWKGKPINHERTGAKGIWSLAGWARHMRQLRA